MKTQHRIKGDANNIQNFSHILKSLKLDGYEIMANGEVVVTLEHADEIEIKNKILSAKTADEINQIDLELSGEINKYKIDEDPTAITGYNLIINGVKINDTVFNEEMIGYRPEERRALIEDLQQMLAEARQMGRDSDATMMDEDIDYLKTLEDKYVFSSIYTNEYVSKSMNPRQFNEICDEIIEANQELSVSANQSKITPLSQQDLTSLTNEIDNLSYDDADKIKKALEFYGFKVSSVSEVNDTSSFSEKSTNIKDFHLSKDNVEFLLTVEQDNSFQLLIRDLNDDFQKLAEKKVSFDVLSDKVNKTMTSHEVIDEAKAFVNDMDKHGGFNDKEIFDDAFERNPLQASIEVLENYTSSEFEENTKVKIENVVDVEKECLQSAKWAIDKGLTLPPSEYSKIDLESEAFKSLDSEVQTTITNYINEQSDKIVNAALEEEKLKQEQTFSITPSV